MLLLIVPIVLLSHVPYIIYHRITFAAFSIAFSILLILQFSILQGMHFWYLSRLYRNGVNFLKKNLFVSM